MGLLWVGEAGRMRAGLCWTICLPKLMAQFLAAGLVWQKPVVLVQESLCCSGFGAGTAWSRCSVYGSASEGLLQRRVRVRNTRAAGWWMWACCSRFLVLSVCVSTLQPRVGEKLVLQMGCFADTGTTFPQSKGSAAPVSGRAVADALLPITTSD